MATSSTGSCRYNVFLSFSHHDVLSAFVSYLLMATDRRFINSFFNNRRSSQIGPELLSAIKEATISIVIFSKYYASSTCLNELVEIHKCYKELDQKVIPVFYDVNPSDVRKRDGEFGKNFMETCKDKTDDVKQRWIKALTDVANIAGEHLRNWPSEAHMVEKIVEHVAIMASSSGSREVDVFPSFSGAVVRQKFLSHLRMALDRRSIILFDDNGIGRSSQIGPELISAIRKARISIVIFSETYASSTWCLNELVEIHKCYKEKELNQMVIPVFYNVNPSEVRKLDGPFGNSFMKTCEDKKKGDIQSWKQALTIVADMGGEDLRNWPSEAHMVEKIANDVSNKLFSPSNGFGDFVGIEAHIEAMKSILCLESEEPRMIGICGQSGIGKSVLGRALFTHLSPKFRFHAFLTYKSTDQDDFRMKLYWEKQLLEEIFDRDIKVDHLGIVEPILKGKKVLIILDDVVKLEYLKTLVGKTKWFGPGSRIIVITQDRQILKDHNIYFLYEVKIPNEDLALKMLCQSAFGQNSPPEDFKELAVEVAKVAGNLPLGLRVLGLSLKRRTKEEWTKVLPGLQNGLEESIMNPLRVSYNRLKEKEKEIFLGIASLFNGKSVKSIEDFFGDYKGGLKRLAEKSLVSLTSNKEIVVEVHGLLVKLGREIVRAESKKDPGKRRFLIDAEEIQHVFINQTGTKNVLGIFFDMSKLKEYGRISIDEKSFIGLLNLRFLHIHTDYNCPELDLVYLPPKLKLLDWNYCPLKRLPSSFRAQFLIELRMENSKLEKLWEGTQPLGSLKTIVMCGSKYLKEIPNLSKAINIERVNFSGCDNLERFPSPLNWKFLEYLNLIGCKRLKNFPQMIMDSSPHGIEIRVDDSLWNKKLPGLNYLDCLRGCNPTKFLPEHIVRLEVKGTTMEKLWEGVQWLGSLKYMNLSESENLKEIPDLSKTTNLTYLNLSHCISLETLPFTIGNLQKLEKLEMKECKGLEVLPVDVNLPSLKILNLNGCSSLTSFPRISRNIEELYLNNTAIEEVPCLIEMFQRLTILSMRGCNKLNNISPNIFRLTNLKQVDFTNCGDIITVLGDAAVVATIEDPYGTIEKGNTIVKDKDRYDPWYFTFDNCLRLDRDARELIIQSSLKWTMVLPGGEVPSYFKHRADGDSITVTLPESSLSHQFLRFNICVVVESLTGDGDSLHLYFRFNGKFYKHVVYVANHIWKTDHLVFCSFKIWTTGLPSTFNFNDVEIKFKFKDDADFNYSSMRIKEVGIRVLNVSTSPDDRDEEALYQSVRNSLEKNVILQRLKVARSGCGFHQ